MQTSISVFLPRGTEEETRKNVAALAADGAASSVTVVEGAPQAAATLRHIAGQADADYTLLYLTPGYKQPGYLALDRMAQVMRMTGAAMAYADHYLIGADGKRRDAPAIDYQEGSLRDDFDFGSMVIIRTDALRQAAGRMATDYRAAGFYDLRLKLSRLGPIVRIPEPLYAEVELDTRKTGERLFDYVDPRNRDAQAEMEQACTDHLKAVGAWLAPRFSEVDIDAGDFPVEASVMIPVRNRIRTIDDALDSALGQETDFAYNVFVVENGPDRHSTDGTTERVDERASRDERIIHIVTDRRDLGVGGSWNMAAHHPLCGRFICQLDSDDVYASPHTLQRVVEEFRRQRVAMLIGAYRLTDIHLRTLPPGTIDHREWTPENGRNNALRINGLGAPRAFFTPVVRRVMLPNVNYGEDYALGLAISRDYQIGRVYDVLYDCRRWDDNSDGDLSREKENRNNLYKDRIRTWELMARQAKVKAGRDGGEEG